MEDYGVNMSFAIKAPDQKTGLAIIILHKETKEN